MYRSVFFNDTATTEIYTLSLHDALPISDARPQQAEVVVDLRDRADRRARIARGRLLVDGAGRRQALDRIDVRLLHLPQELTGVGGERFHVPALALAVDRVEGQRRLP